MDIATAPILEDFIVDGRPVKAVSIMGKQAMLYVFDRVDRHSRCFRSRNGRCRRATCPASGIRRRSRSHASRRLRSPGRHARQPDRLHARTARRSDTLVSRYKLGPIFTPTVVSKVEGPIASFRSSGGTNWPGGAFDPETHVLYIPSYTSLPTIGLLPPPNKEFSDMRYVSGLATTGVRYISGPGENAGADAPSVAVAERPQPRAARGANAGRGAVAAGRNAAERA